jgi:hypothetical protein
VCVCVVVRVECSSVRNVRRNFLLVKDPKGWSRNLQSLFKASSSSSSSVLVFFLFFSLAFGAGVVFFSFTFCRGKNVCVEKNTRKREDVKKKKKKKKKKTRGDSFPRRTTTTTTTKKMTTTTTTTTTTTSRRRRRRRAFLLLFCVVVVGLVSSSSTRTRSSFLFVEGAKTKRLSLSETDFGAILISEIMYNPTKRGEAKEMGDAGRTYGEASGEWVEFLNPSVTNVVDVSGWYFSDEKNLPDDDDDDDKDSSSAMFQFPLNTKMQPQERIVVAKNVTKFQISYGNDTNATASINVIKDDELPFKLSNKGEKVFLLNAKKEIVHEVEYDDKAPWPIIFAGYSIELTSAKSDATDPYSWVSSLIFGGTPGRASRSFMDDD